MTITGIVAMDERGAIGRGGAIPWRYPADLRFFKEQTLHHACVMGHSTWLSLPKPLPQRLNIVMSRRAEIQTLAGAVVLRDKAQVLALAEYLAGDLYIIGGAQIYRVFQTEIRRWVVTRVPLTVADADAFVPPDFLDGFAPASSRRIDDELRATFYERT